MRISVFVGGVSAAQYAEGLVLIRRNTQAIVPYGLTLSKSCRALDMRWTIA